MCLRPRSALYGASTTSRVRCRLLNAPALSGRHTHAHCLLFHRRPDHDLERGGAPCGRRDGAVARRRSSQIHSRPHVRPSPSPPFPPPPTSNIIINININSLLMCHLAGCDRGGEKSIDGLTSPMWKNRSPTRAPSLFAVDLRSRLTPPASSSITSASPPPLPHPSASTVDFGISEIIIP